MGRSLRVLVGVSGGIAAFKTAELVRRLQEAGCEVRCSVTRAAAAFVTPLTLEVLSGAPVYQEEYLGANGSGQELHITTAAWADVLCLAPATANLLSRLALGLADDFLTTTALAFGGPVVFAPAMHSEMWTKEVLRGHVATLEGRGMRRIGPEVGRLASGERGAGRMAEPERITAEVLAASGSRGLEGRTVVVTAGPTREPIDDVRFLSNRSSGRMGFALAAAAAEGGARVVLVAGPVDLATPWRVERVDVTTALEMGEALERLASEADLVVMAAAVADYRLAKTFPGKVKRHQGPPDLDLVENPDLLVGLAEWAPDALRVGFAAESGEVEAEARRKLVAKGVHLLVANDVSRRDIGFDVDANEVTVFRPTGEPVFFERRPKLLLARDLMDLFVTEMERREQTTPAAARP